MFVCYRFIIPLAALKLLLVRWSLVCQGKVITSSRCDFSQPVSIGSRQRKCGSTVGHLIAGIHECSANEDDAWAVRPVGPYECCIKCGPLGRLRGSEGPCSPMEHLVQRTMGGQLGRPSGLLKDGLLEGGVPRVEAGGGARAAAPRRRPALPTRRRLQGEAAGLQRLRRSSVSHVSQIERRVQTQRPTPSADFETKRGRWRLCLVSMAWKRREP